MKIADLFPAIFTRSTCVAPRVFVGRLTTQFVVNVAVTILRAERVNDFAPPFVMNLLRKVVLI